METFPIPIITSTPVAIHWPLAEQPLSLGNLLIFRQEIELLAKLRCTNEVTIFFTGSSFVNDADLSADKGTPELPPYFYEAWLSQLSITPVFCSVLSQEIDWPPQDLEINSWGYSSFRRLAILAQIAGVVPQLLWPTEIKRQAEALYAYLQNANEKVIAVHLKRQTGGPEESNADIEAWQMLFEENNDKQFFLLGKDQIPDTILSLPNVMAAQKLEIPLSVQLAFCDVCDGFMGMASGICAGAFFSAQPYVVFKHPRHHEEEMKKEIGDADCLPFSKGIQKLWRKVDSVENLRSALRMVTL